MKISVVVTEFDLVSTNFTLFDCKVHSKFSVCCCFPLKYSTHHLPIQDIPILIITANIISVFKKLTSVQ